MKDETVYMVSGSMRSGTTMMMKALKAGGMNAYYDPNNEYHEPRERFFEELDFPEKFKGRLLKCFWQRLQFIKPGPKIKIVFMRRHAEEIEQSFKVFFGNNRTFIMNAFDEGLDICIKDTLNNPNTEILQVWYRDVLENPRKEFEKIKEFGLDIDIDKCIEIVDPAQCHFKKEEF